VSLCTQTTHAFALLVPREHDCLFESQRRAEFVTRLMEAYELDRGLPQPAVGGGGSNGGGSNAPWPSGRGQRAAGLARGGSNARHAPRRALKLNFLRRICLTTEDGQVRRTGYDEAAGQLVVKKYTPRVESHRGAELCGFVCPVCRVTLGTAGDLTRHYAEAHAAGNEAGGARAGGARVTPEPQRRQSAGSRPAIAGRVVQSAPQPRRGQPQRQEPVAESRLQSLVGFFGK
jgi:hypothetical protein